MFNFFKEKKEPKPTFVQEKCYIVNLYDSVIEGNLRRLASGKIIVSANEYRWTEANPDGTTKTPDGDIKGWFQ